MRELMMPRGLATATACLLLSGSLNGQELPKWASKLSIHGYLSQAYAVSDDYPIFGIPTEGTTDYRDLALQFRYDQDKKNIFAVQFRQQRLGESPKASALEDVELDWAFYQHNLSDRLALKAGRIPLPLGIFNEAAGAATTSPFFRPPDEFYERQYTSKTLEGVLGTMSLKGPAAWTFDVDAYFGQWLLDERGRTGERVDARNAVGGQIWANSPWPGVRAGGGAYRCEVYSSSNGSVDYLMVHGSIEADLDRWSFATEYLRGNLERGRRYRAYYGQVGLQLTRQVSVHARGAVARIKVPRNGQALDAGLSDDIGLSLNYAIHSALLFKLEGHTNDGLLREDAPQNLSGSPSRTRYLIASVVASF